MTIDDYNQFLQRLNCNGTRKLNYRLYEKIDGDVDD